MLGSRCALTRSLRHEIHAKRQHVVPSESHKHFTQKVQNVKPIKSLYIDTTAPSPTNLKAGTLFFQTHLPLKSWTATEWRKFQPHNSGNDNLTPEVTFLGRSNSGKSSLLNALLADPVLCRVGPKPGKTTTMHAWSLSPIDPSTKGARRGFGADTEPRLNVLDMPGYGHGSHGDWGADIMKYLTSRRQLRRAFVLVNPAHGLKKGDLQMLELLRTHGVSHQMIACKCDHQGVGPLEAALYALRQTLESQFGSEEGGPALLTIADILAVGGLGDGKANQNVKVGQMKGVEDVRWAVLRAAGLDEYALALLSNGGVPPKAPLLSGSELTDPQSTLETHTPAQVQRIKPENRTPLPGTDNVGMGMDEFIAMAAPPTINTTTRKSQSPRQQRMRQRSLTR